MSDAMRLFEFENSGFFDSPEYKNWDRDIATMPKEMRLFFDENICDPEIKAYWEFLERRSNHYQDLRM
jgi:hypothetical protein